MSTPNQPTKSQLWVEAFSKSKGASIVVSQFYDEVAFQDKARWRRAIESRDAEMPLFDVELLQVSPGLDAGGMQLMGISFEGDIARATIAYPGDWTEPPTMGAIVFRSLSTRYTQFVEPHLLLVSRVTKPELCGMLIAQCFSLPELQSLL